MENTTAKKNSKADGNKAHKIKETYMDYLLEHGKQPPSVYQFAKSLKMKESAFYEYYNSFAAIEKEIWRGFFEDAVNRIQSESVYNGYSVREKLLAFYYTWIEVLKDHRSYVAFSVGQNKTGFRPLRVEALNAFKHDFYAFVNELISEGKETNEIVDRPFIGNTYNEGLWQQLLFVLNFWVKDDSKNFEQTDVAIEKAVNLSFDIMGRGPLDTAVDLARFLFQKRRN